MKFEISPKDMPKELARIDSDGKLHVHEHVYTSWKEIVNLLYILFEFARTKDLKVIDDQD